MCPSEQTRQDRMRVARSRGGHGISVLHPGRWGVVMVQIGSGTDWIALSDRAGQTGGAEVADGLFVAELRLPIDGPQVLLDQRSADGAEVFSILHDAAAGLSVLHRRDGRLTRHELPGPLPVDRATARLEFGWNTGRDLWRLEFRLLTDGHGTGLRIEAQGRGLQGLGAGMLSDLCAGRGQRHDAVLWFGVTGGAMPVRRAWVGPRSKLRTVRGPVAAEDLRVGEVVVTRNGLVPILGLARHAVPARGSFQPVLLRAPWFGASDILVSGEQLVRLGGPEAEYLFGEEEVLVPAHLLVDGQSALAEVRRAVVTGITVDLGGAELIEVQGCTLCTEPPPGLELPLRLLDRYEAVPLMAQLGRLPQRAVG